MKQQFIQVWVDLREWGGPARFYDMSLDMIWEMIWAHQELRRVSTHRHPYDPEWMDEISTEGRVLPELQAGVM